MMMQRLVSWCIDSQAKCQGTAIGNVIDAKDHMHPLNAHLRMQPVILVGKEATYRKHVRQKGTHNGVSHQPQQAKGTHLVEESDQEDVEEYYMFKVSSKHEEPIQVTVRMDLKEVVMEVDTGASLSLINEDTYITHFGKDRSSLQKAPVHLRTYTKEEVPTLGSCLVTVQYGEQTKELPVIVVPGSGPNLCGRDWLAQLQLDWKTVFWTQRATLTQVLNAHKEVFDKSLGKIEGFKARLYVDPQMKPIFFKPRQVPQAMKEKIDTELRSLEEQGIIVPVKYSSWAAPVVPILKPDGTL